MIKSLELIGEDTLKVQPLRAISILCLIFIIICCVSCGKKNKDVDAISISEKEKQSLFEVEKNNLLVKYNAEEMIYNRFKMYYTYNLQMWRKSINNKNLMFRGFIKDVFVDGGEFYIVFGCPVGTHMSNRTITFYLKTNKSDIADIIDNPPHTFVDEESKYIYPNYLVICSINDIMTNNPNICMGRMALVKGKLLYVVRSRDLINTKNNK